MSIYKVDNTRQVNQVNAKLILTVLDIKQNRNIRNRFIKDHFSPRSTKIFALKTDTISNYKVEEFYLNNHFDLFKSSCILIVPIQIRALKPFLDHQSIVIFDYRQSEGSVTFSPNLSLTHEIKSRVIKTAQDVDVWSRREPIFRNEVFFTRKGYKLTEIKECLPQNPDAEQKNDKPDES